MQNWRIDLCWDGAGYCGWQSQKKGHSIQEAVEKSLSLAFGGEQISTTVAGRTDAGVHAMQQIISFFAETDRPEHSVSNALNAFLPKDIRCIHAQKMPSEFCARHSSKRKMYRYRVLNRAVDDPLRMGRVWWVRKSMNMEIIQQQLIHFVGEHDFESFRSSGCSATTTMRRIESFSCRNEGDEVIFDVIGKGFLRHQVRIMVGTLVDMSRESMEKITIPDILQAKDRRLAGMTAPPYGLYLVWTELDSE